VSAVRAPRRSDEAAARPVRREPVRIDSALARFLRAHGIRQHGEQPAACRAWSEALGSELAARARPVAFRDGVLTVEVRSAAHLHELQNFTGDAFRASANERLGKAEIRRVQFRLQR
jgi:hypothetical protein